MPPKAQRLSLKIPVAEIPEHIGTPSHAAVMWFIVVRDMEGQPAPTRAELVEFVGMSPRTTAAAVNHLMKEGVIG